MYLKGYIYHKGVPYVWDKKDNTALGQIIAKLRKLFPGDNTEEMYENCRQLFGLAFNKAPFWIKKSIKVGLINQEFNVITASGSFDRPKERRYSKTHYFKDEEDTENMEKDFTKLGGLINSIIQK